MIIKIIKISGVSILILIGFFFAGPRPTFEQVNPIPSDAKFNIHNLNKIISERESSVEYLKPDNESRIIWADSLPTKTEYAIVYLHGFTASQGEGYPMHKNIADSLNANLYLPRLPEHGIHHKDAMKNLTPEKLIEAAKDAIAIGKTLGEKVIVMGCSTGGTLAIYLASGDPDIKALILISPNIALKNGTASLMTGPWGRQLAHQLIGEHRDMTQFQNVKKYWSYVHHTNGLIALQSLMDQTMTDEVFKKISIPVYCGYFYKNEEVQDPVVSVPAMLHFKEIIQSNPEDVEFESFEQGNHVLGSIYKNEHWQAVQDEVLSFIKTELSEGSF